MKMKIEERKKLLINNKKHLEEKQDTFLRFRTLSYHRNRHIGLHYKNSTLTRERTYNIQIKNHELDKTKL